MGWNTHSELLTAWLNAFRRFRDDVRLNKSALPVDVLAYRILCYIRSYHYSMRTMMNQEQNDVR